jgi:hypothetical protein
MEVTIDEAKEVGRRLGLDPDLVTAEELKAEMEGCPTTSAARREALVEAGRCAVARLHERPDYYIGMARLRSAGSSKFGGGAGRRPLVAALLVFMLLVLFMAARRAVSLVSRAGRAGARTPTWPGFFAQG